MRETREDNAIRTYHNICLWVGKVFFGTLVTLSGTIVIFGAAAAIEFLNK